MGAKMLRINLSEMKAVRVVCKSCNRAVVEVPVDALDTALENFGCRFCGAKIFPTRSPDPLSKLKVAIDELSRVADKLGIEFEIQAPP